MEGTVSQNFDKNPSFYFMKSMMKKISKSYPFFSNKIRTRTLLNILRNASLGVGVNVRSTHRKFQFKILFSYRHILVQKIKVKKSLFN